MDISRPYTVMDDKSRRNFEEGWERVFGKKKRKRVKMGEKKTVAVGVEGDEAL